jgi:ComF family protein
MARGIESVRARFRAVRFTRPNVRSAAAAVGKSLLGLVYPPQCVLCSVDLPAAHDGLMLCAGCRENLSPPVVGWCGRCGAPLNIVAAAADECSLCAGQVFAWERTVALGRYQGELGAAVRRTKTAKASAVTMALAGLLVHQRGDVLRQLQTAAVVPMPMHWARRVRRGINGPELIAETVAQRLGLPLVNQCLQRTQLTRLQTELSPTERQVNQRNSFRVRRVHRVKGKRILLIDDVLTTGATANVAAKALLKAGATTIFVAALARGIGDDGV